MNRTTIDVKTEARKLATSKPVHAAAGAGVLASAALRELPARIARWRSDGSLAALPARAGEYMSTARTRAVQEYDKLATHGARVLNGKTALPRGSGKKS
jgi:hypothetical protein